jgi:hypothetical protein
MFSQDILYLCAFSGGMLAMHVDASNENVPRAHLPMSMFLLQGAIATLTQEALGQMHTYIKHTSRPASMPSLQPQQAHSHSFCLLSPGQEAFAFPDCANDISTLDEAPRPYGACKPN